MGEIFGALTFSNMLRDSTNWAIRGASNLAVESVPALKSLSKLGNAAKNPPFSGVEDANDTSLFSTKGGTSENKRIYDGGEFSLRKHAKHAKKIADRQKKLKEIYGGDYEKYL